MGRAVSMPLGERVSQRTLAPLFGVRIPEGLYNRIRCAARALPVVRATFMVVVGSRGWYDEHNERPGHTFHIFH